MQSLIKNLAFAFSLALLVWLGYIVFFQTGDSVVTSAASAQVAADSAAFLTKLEELKQIHLKEHSAVLLDPRFQSLIDQRQVVESKPYGRPDPFVPTTAPQVTSKK